MNGPILIIAEAGVNHNGDLSLAHRLIDAAAAAKATAVKFQTFNAEKLAAKHAPRADYQKRHHEAGDQVSMLKSLELRPEWHAELARHCADAGVEFMSTPFDADSADLLRPLVQRFKVGSGDLTDLPLLEHIASLGRPVILSTGMATEQEIEPAVSVIAKWNVPLTLLHCTSLYPAPLESVNLRAIETLRKRFSLPVGYSDHTLGIAVSTAAAALGAVVIEKHFTLDRSLPGPDHAASLEPNELASLVQSIRVVEAAQGDGIKRIMPGEEAIRRVARKSVVAAVDLTAGLVLNSSMLTIKRPGTGIPPGEIGSVIGRRLRRPVRMDEAITWETLE